MFPAEGGRRFSGRDCTESAFCGIPAANAASIPAERGILPAAIAQNQPSAALQLQTRQTFQPKGTFLQPRLHEIGVLRHSSCKRGKHSCRKRRSPGRDCTESAFYGSPVANAASIRAERSVSPAAIAQNQPSTALQLQTRQAFRPKGAFAASTPAEGCVSPAAIARNRRSAALQLQTWQAEQSQSQNRAGAEQNRAQRDRTRKNATKRDEGGRDRPQTTDRAPA